MGGLSSYLPVAPVPRQRKDYAGVSKLNCARRALFLTPPPGTLRLYEKRWEISLSGLVSRGTEFGSEASSVNVGFLRHATNGL